MKSIKILFIYSCREYPTRPTIISNIYALKSYNTDTIYYYNISFRKDLFFLRLHKFDVVIFHHSVTVPWNKKRFYSNIKLLKKYTKDIKIKAAFFQDEHFGRSRRCDFINELGITHLFSVSNGSELKNIYNNVNLDTLKTFSVLTGYLNDPDIEYVRKASSSATRSIDIGYRTAVMQSFYLGKVGYKKEEIADVFLTETSRYGLKCDIKKGLDNMYKDKDWYKFLLNCKYTIGSESGASLLDDDGSTKLKVINYLKKHPYAAFEEVESACFPGLDGSVDTRALSPRHIEACLTKTCQVLTEGNYNGVLKPWIHYIPLKFDLSNINEVLDVVKQDKMRDKIINKAYEDIIESGKYTTKYFYNFVFNSLEIPLTTNKPDVLNKILVYINNFLDTSSWFIAGIYSNVVLKVARLMRVRI